MPDVICLGELLVDFVSEHPNTPLESVVSFRRAPGGAPANVACGVAKLGLSSGFIGKVGRDPFGAMLRHTLQRVGVDTTALAETDEARTSLVFVGVHDDGRKDMCFYRHPGADMLLGPDDVDAEAVADARAFHFGSISLMDPGPRQATVRAAGIARDHGLLVTFDPNYRDKLWSSEAAAQQRIREGLHLADVAKISEEEWRLVTGEDDFEAGARAVMAMGPRLVVVSHGDAGCLWFQSDGGGGIRESGRLAGFGVETVETTGAGDGFMASLIVDLLAERAEGREPEALDATALERIARRANAVGALTVTRAGAIPGLPRRDEVDRFLAEQDA